LAEACFVSLEGDEMLAARLFECGPLFTTISETRWPEIERGIRPGVQRVYTLDLAGVECEQDLLASLLACFEIPGGEETAGLIQDACLDDIRVYLPMRAEDSVMLAVFNLGDLPERNLTAFLTLVSLLTCLKRDIRDLTPSENWHRVLLTVVFFGAGHNYPEVSHWES
jgi:hypothetical protein